MTTRVVVQGLISRIDSFVYIDFGERNPDILPKSNSKITK